MILISWTTLILILYVLSTLTGSPLLQLDLIVFLPALLLSFAAVFIASRHFSMSIPKDITASKNNEVTIPIKVKNNSVIPFPKVQGILRGTNKLTGEYFEQYVDLAVGGKKNTTINITFESETCGKIELEIFKLRFFDYFGILHKTEKVSYKSSLTVLPDTFDLTYISEITKTTPEDSNDYSKTRPGNDLSEIFQIRDYVEGDSIRQIHWKLTQKFDHLITKEASLPVDNNVLILFDTVCPYSSYQYMDAAAEVVSSLSQALISNGVFHSIAWKNSIDELKEAKISSTEDLYYALSGLLESKSSNNISVLDAYLSEHSSFDIPYIIAVCAAVPIEPDATSEADMSVICGYNPDDNLKKSDNGVSYYDINNYKEDLANIIF